LLTLDGSEYGATPSWILSYPFDRRDFRFPPNFRYSLSGPHAVTAVLARKIWSMNPRRRRRLAPEVNGHEDFAVVHEDGIIVVASDAQRVLQRRW